MNVEVILTERPIALQSTRIEGAGAFVCFEGIIRPLENGKRISGIRYEAYEPMAKKEIRKILNDLHEENPLLFARVQHRLGWVPVGETAITVEIATTHRAAAFYGVSQFMDALKGTVPIWKAECQISD